MTTVIVAGHHRSGTSMLAQMLHGAGLFLGQDLMPAAPSNRHGHFEDLEIVRLHQTILDDNGHNWQLAEDLIPVVSNDLWDQISDLVERRERDHEIWGFKDPRVSVFLPLWKHVSPETKVVAIYRHPSSCIESIQKRAVRSLREGTAPAAEVFALFEDPDLALRLWAVSNRGILRACAAYGGDVLVVGHDHLVAGLPLVEIINDRWSLELRSSPTTVIDSGAITAAIAPLRATDPKLRTEVDEIWAALRGHSNAVSQ